MSPLSQILSELQGFWESSWGEISVLPNFQISKSHSVFEILTPFFACELNFCRGPNLLIATWSPTPLLHWFCSGGTPHSGLWCDTSSKWVLLYPMPHYGRGCRIRTLIMVSINFWWNSDLFWHGLTWISTILWCNFAFEMKIHNLCH